MPTSATAGGRYCTLAEKPLNTFAVRRGGVRESEGECHVLRRAKTPAWSIPR